MNWITKIIKAGEKIKTAIHKRASKEDIANSDWTSCCKGPILKKDLEENLWVCPDCNKHHRINPRQRFDILFGKNNYEVFKTPIPKDDPLNWTDSRTYKERLKSARKKTGMDCGMMVVSGKIDDIYLFSKDLTTFESLSLFNSYDISKKNVDENIVKCLRSKIDIATEVLGEDLKSWLV
mgnify:CR=1 FL=1